MDNYYEILQVSQNASKEVIEMAYKALAKKYHPDVNQTEDKNQSEENMKILNKARDVLTNQFLRIQYDDALKSENITIELPEEIPEDFGKGVLFRIYSSPVITRNKYKIAISLIFLTVSILFITNLFTKKDPNMIIDPEILAPSAVISPTKDQTLVAIVTPINSNAQTNVNETSGKPENTIVITPSPSKSVAISEYSIITKTKTIENGTYCIYLDGTINNESINEPFWILVNPQGDISKEGEKMYYYKTLLNVYQNKFSVKLYCANNNVFNIDIVQADDDEAQNAMASLSKENGCTLPAHVSLKFTKQIMIDSLN